MNEREKELIQDILKNKISTAAFSGMIFNAVVKTNRPAKELITEAINVRLTLEDMGK